MNMGTDCFVRQQYCLETAKWPEKLATISAKVMILKLCKKNEKLKKQLEKREILPNWRPRYVKSSLFSQSWNWNTQNRREKSK